MIRSEDARIQKILEAFETLGLSGEEMEVVLKYLHGEAGDEVLDKLTFRSLEQCSQETKTKFCEAQTSLIRKRCYEELKKVFNILFALGHSTCANVLSRDFPLISDHDLCGTNCALNPVKLAAAKAETMSGRCHHPLRSYELDSLFKDAGASAENIYRAMEYCKGSTANARLILMTLYFLKKYPCNLQESSSAPKQPVSETGKSTNEMVQKSGMFGAISRLFGGKEENSKSMAVAAKSQEWVNTAAMEARDAALLKNYEDLLTGNVSNIFKISAGSTAAKGRVLSQDVLKKLPEAVKTGDISKDVLSEIRGADMDESLFEIIGGSAYVNYVLSEQFRNILKLCAATNPQETLNMAANIDARKSLKAQGENFDDIFQISAVELIAWAAERGFNGRYDWRSNTENGLLEKILKVQLLKSKAAYLEYYKKASFEGANRMLNVIKTADPELYENLLNSGAGEQKEKVIQRMVSRLSETDKCMAYLRGEEEVEALYGIEDKIISSNYYYAGSGEWNILEGYSKNYDDKDFYNRCVVLMAIAGMSYFFHAPLSNNNREINKEYASGFFKSMDEGGLDIAHQLNAFVSISDAIYNTVRKADFINDVKPIFLQYLSERGEEAKKAFSETEAYARYFKLCIMEQEAEEFKEDILSYSNDTAKVVKEKLEEILKGKITWREDVAALLHSKKAAQRELGIRVLLHWNTDEDLEALRKVLETEKNAKIRNLLESTLQQGEGGSGTAAGIKVLTQEELIKNLHKGGKKRSLAWAYEAPFSQVHKKSGEPAAEEYMQAILLCYAAMTTPGVNKDAKMLAEDLNESELAMFVNELFDKWLEAGAEVKKRWVLYAASIHGGSDIVKKLHHQIQEWPNNARGAIAAEAVQALALKPQPQALLLVDSIARKFKFKQVKVAAGKALEYAAEQLGLTRAELEDKIVPDLDFDENMERHFDYGERNFTVTITPALEIEIVGADGKKLKNLPAPGKKDDEQKAKESYGAFKEMKKQMKTTVSSQKMRLEQAISSERLWSISAWKDLFVKNPVMHQFAIGLIWGIYEEGKLVQCFRYMEDGSFNTEEEDEYILPEQGYIGLVHPIELTEESRENWKQQLEDYEIIQPIEQLGRPVFTRTEEEEKRKVLERFGGLMVNDLSLNGKLLQLGWYKGSVQDAGCFDTYFREDNSLGLGVELHFSGTYVACEGEDVTVYDARFYKAGTITRGSYMYIEADDEKQIPLKQIPERYFSEIVLQLTKATASSKERDENWRKDK